MDHLAILSKGELLNKIITGEKKIESRWYKFNKDPFNSISQEDTIYFKQSGQPVTVRATVATAKFYDNLNPKKIGKIFTTYRRALCADESYLADIENKKYCTLIFLKDVEEIEPFRINKQGYGMMSAWIKVRNIQEIKL
jgi:ASC-1-like (ASCH) protein